MYKNEKMEKKINDSRVSKIMTNVLHNMSR